MPGVIPAPRPVRATLSLVNAAVAVEEQDARWELGYRFQPEHCSGGYVEDPCQVVARTAPVLPADVEVEPFLVVAPDRCSAFGFVAEDYEGRARRLLERCESNLIASELWTGTLANARSWPNLALTDVTSDTVTNGPTGAIAALACLEAYLADCGCGERGMIHATPQVVSHWAALGNSVLRREGNLLLTIHDTIIVSDGGYPGTCPASITSTTNQWAYATGLVTVKRGPVEIIPPTFEEALDRAVNTVTYFAQRPASATWDGCCHGAAQVDIAPCLIGGAS